MKTTLSHFSLSSSFSQNHLLHSSHFVFRELNPFWGSRKNPTPKDKNIHIIYVLLGLTYVDHPPHDPTLEWCIFLMYIFFLFSSILLHREEIGALATFPKAMINISSIAIPPKFMGRAGNTRVNIACCCFLPLF